jgi:hypothetical protein
MASSYIFKFNLIYVQSEIVNEIENKIERGPTLLRETPLFFIYFLYLLLFTSMFTTFN